MSASALIDLPRLVDLALGTPENGAVNFNVLHALLHSIVHLLNSEHVRIELIDIPLCKSESPDALLKSGIKQTVIEEFQIAAGKKTPVKKTLRDVEKVIRVLKSGKETTIENTEPLKFTSQSPKTSKEKKPTSDKRDLKETQPQSAGGVVVNNMEEILNIAKRMDKSDSKILELEDDLKDLKQRHEILLNRITDFYKNNDPKKYKEIEELVSQKNDKPEKRKELGKFEKKRVATDKSEKRAEISKFEKRKEQLDKSERRRETDNFEKEEETDKSEKRKEPSEKFEKLSKTDKSEKRKEQLDKSEKRGEIDKFEKSRVSNEIKKGRIFDEDNFEDVEAESDNEAYSGHETSKTEVFYDNKQITAIEEEVRNIKNEIDEIKKKMKENKTGTVEGQKEIHKGDLDCFSTSFEFSVEKECSNFIKTLNHKFDRLSGKFLDLNDRLLDIEKEVSQLSESIENITSNKDGKISQVTILDLLNEIGNIKKFVMETINKFEAKLLDNENIHSKIVDLTGSIKKLSKTKIDKYDLEELLAEKVDYNMLERKVSLDHLDATKRDLESVMFDTITKIQERDEDWCKTIQFLKKELELKLNAAEIVALRLSFEKRFQTLDDKLGAFYAEKKEPDAAGTSKVLKDLCCISCNRCVLMKTEDMKTPQLKGIKAQKSIKPFLTFELDNIRKQMKDSGRNLRQFETILKTDGIIVDNKARQICNRYCGGSHTIITATDRVKRGRCDKLAQKVEVKCICEPIEPPPCPCPDEKEEDVCPCPSEPEVCPCPSDDDHLNKCATKTQKRCTELDRQRRRICEESLQKRREFCMKEIERYRRNEVSCEDLRKRKFKCSRVDNLVDKSKQCQSELRKYERCMNVTNIDRDKRSTYYDYNIDTNDDKRNTRLSFFNEVNPVKKHSIKSIGEESIEKHEKEKQSYLIEDVQDQDIRPDEEQGLELHKTIETEEVAIEQTDTKIDQFPIEEQIIVEEEEQEEEEEEG